MRINYHDLSAVRKAGVEVLAKELGTVGMAQFIRQFDTGHGNYTTERGQWLDAYSMDEIIEEIDKK